MWAVGVSSDTKEPMHTAVCKIPAGVIDMPVHQFVAHMDRTTIIGADGRQVFQVHLWKETEIREFALFTPRGSIICWRTIGIFKYEKVTEAGCIQWP
jgi:hypothetical protein